MKTPLQVVDSESAVRDTLVVIEDINNLLSGGETWDKDEVLLVFKDSQQCGNMFCKSDHKLKLLYPIPLRKLVYYFFITFMRYVGAVG